ncbi:hypothetical protein MBLNU459_g1539t1 [Dothideomycetes sp. NU459]
MQSPQLPRQQSPASPSQSHYSLDLDALGFDDSLDESSLQLARPRIDSIASDDIDGPSDFTINLGKWMRGSPKKLRPGSSFTQPEQNASEHSQDTVGSDPPTPQSQQASSRADDTQTSATENTSTGSGQKNASVEAMDNTVMHINNADGQTPHRDLSAEIKRVFGSSPVPQQISEGSATPRATSAEDSSILNTVIHSQSLPKQRRFLQPTVEDYNSELSPARPASVAQPTFQVSPKPPPRSLSKINRKTPSPGRPSSPTLSPVRTPLVMRTDTSSDVENNAMQTLRAELEKSRRAQAEATKLNEELRSELSKVRDSYSRMQFDLDSSKKLDEETTRWNEELRSELSKVRDSYSQVQHDLKSSRTVNAETAKGNDELRSELSRMRDSHSKVQRDLASSRKREEEAARQAAVQAETHNQELSTLRASLMEQAFALAESHRQELLRLQSSLEKKFASETAGQADAHRQELSTLRSELEQEAAMEAEMQAEAHNEELSTLRSSLEEAAASKAALQTHEHQKALVALRNSLDQQLSTRMQARDKTWREKLDTATAALQSAKDELASQQDLAATFDQQLALRIEQRDDVWRKQLDTTTAALQSAKDELAAQQDVAATFDQQLATHIEQRDDVWRKKLDAAAAALQTTKDELAATFDRKLATRMQRHDDGWRQKLERSKSINRDLKALKLQTDAELAALRNDRTNWEAERKIMAKALLLQFGREECGIMEPETRDVIYRGKLGQRYAYKYSKAAVTTAAAPASAGRV